MALLGCVVDVFLRSRKLFFCGTIWGNHCAEGPLKVICSASYLYVLAYSTNHLSWFRVVNGFLVCVSGSPLQISGDRRGHGLDLGRNRFSLSGLAVMACSDGELFLSLDLVMREWHYSYRVFPL
jgi:hypothetical protein